jgi:hypothetical protein
MSASAAANQTIPATETVLFKQQDDGGHCQEFFVGVRPTAANPLNIHVDGLHQNGEFVGVPQGASVSFRAGASGIARVSAKGEGGDCDGVDWGVLSRVGY